MRILVVDDTQRNLDAAVQQLGGLHEVVTTSSYADALERLFRGEQFDAVLTDLIMPAEETKLSREAAEKFVGSEFPAGLGIVIKSLQKSVRYIGVLSLSNHHEGPSAAMYDFLSGFPMWGIYEGMIPRKLGDSWIFFCEAGEVGLTALVGVGQVKDWAWLLAQILEEEAEAKVSE